MDSQPHVPQNDRPNDPGGPGSSEDFPRADLARRVGAAQAQQDVRFRIAIWTLAAGIALLALGLPTQRYFELQDSLWPISGSGPAPRGFLTLPIYLVHKSFGLPLEAAGFLISAILMGLSYPALVRLLTVVGFERTLAMGASAIALCTPVAWLGGTLPIEYSAGLLGSTLLATELFRTQQGRPFGYLWRASCFLLGAFLLSPENLWLILPTLWAVHQQARSKDLGGLSALGLISVFALCLWINLGDRADPARALQRLAFGSGLGSESLTAHGLFWLLGLGALWYAFYSMVFSRRVRSTGPPPGWTWVWLITGLTALFAGGVQAGPKGAFLIPLGAVALADRVLHRVDAIHQAKALLALFLAHVLLNLVISLALDTTDPEREWAPHAQGNLQTTDVFLTPSPARAYLAAFRLEVPTCLVSSQEGSACTPGIPGRTPPSAWFWTAGNTNRSDRIWAGPAGSGRRRAWMPPPWITQARSPDSPG